MHGIKLTALLALAASTIMAHDIKVTFKRYSQDGCDAKFWIGKDTHLENPHCKTFDHHEPPFLSFTSNVEDGDATENNCQVTIFDKPGCAGKGFTMADLKNSGSACGNTGGITGRSARVNCQPRPSVDSIVTSIPTSSSTPIIHKPDVTSTVTVKKPKTLSTTTITLVPQPSHQCREVCDGQ